MEFPQARGRVPTSPAELCRGPRGPAASWQKPSRSAHARGSRPRLAESGLRAMLNAHANVFVTVCSDGGTIVCDVHEAFMLAMLQHVGSTGYGKLCLVRGLGPGRGQALDHAQLSDHVQGPHCVRIDGEGLRDCGMYGGVEGRTKI